MRDSNLQAKTLKRSLHEGLWCQRDPYDHTVFVLVEAVKAATASKAPFDSWSFALADIIVKQTLMRQPCAGDGAFTFMQTTNQLRLLRNNCPETAEIETPASGREIVKACKSYQVPLGTTLLGSFVTTDALPVGSHRRFCKQQYLSA